MSEEQSRSWRPMTGMTHSNQRGSLGSSGHRALSYVHIYNINIIFLKLFRLKYFFILGIMYIQEIRITIILFLPHQVYAIFVYKH